MKALYYPEVMGVIAHHHERLDGSGIPGRLRGGDVPLESQVLAAVDIFTTLVWGWPDSPGLDPSQALEAVRGQTGLAFKGEVVEALEAILQGQDWNAGW